MKLRDIAENFLMNKMRSEMQCDPDIVKPYYNAGSPLYNPYASVTSGTGSGFMTPGTMPIGTPDNIPNKPRHRQFFGFQARPGTITL